MKTKDEKHDFENANAMRRLLLKIGCETRCRVTYDLVTEFFGARSADELLKLANEKGVRHQRR